MKYLPIKRALSEDTRLDDVVLHRGENGLYALHRGRGDDDAYYITEHAEPDKILMMITRELWDVIFGSGE